MIGQSGLPMMNNLAGSNEKTPEDVQVRATASEAGAFEKILAPDAQAAADVLALETPVDEQLSLLLTGPKSPLADATRVGNTIAHAEANSHQIAVVQPMTATSGETLPRPESVQHDVAPNTAVLEATNGSTNSLQNQELDSQNLPAMSESNEAEPPLAPAEMPMTQPDILADDAEIPLETASGSIDQPAAETGASNILPEMQTNSDRTDMVSVPQDFVESTLLRPESRASGPMGQLVEQTADTAKLLAISNSRSDIPVVSEGTRLPAGVVSTTEPKIQLALQASLQATTSGIDHRAEKTPAAQDEGIVSGFPAVSKAEKSETSALLAATQTTDQKGQLQQPQQNGLGTTPSLSVSDSAAVSLEEPSVPYRTPTSSTGLVSPAEGSWLRTTVPTPSPLIHTVPLENSFLAQSSLAELKEVSIGASSTISTTASSRLDAPTTATVPIHADARLVVQQINQAIIRMDGTRTEVTLDPVELGRVSLTFITKDEGVTVLVNADRPETADLLRRNSEQLQRDLSNAGYEDVELDFSQDDDAHPDPSSANKTDDTGSVQSSTISYDVNFITAGLDIRI